MWVVEFDVVKRSIFSRDSIFSLATRSSLDASADDQVTASNRSSQPASAPPNSGPTTGIAA
jgi:hypothetical protein